jgi:signal transduction histidine kinase
MEMATDTAGLQLEAAAILTVNENGDVALSASRGLPARLAGWNDELEAVDSNLGERLRETWGDLDRDVRTLPLVSDRDLYGALVIFSGRGGTLDETVVRLATGLADVAAISLARMAKYAALARSYAELRASREALAQGEKLRALGQMAAGVSHDLKNILNPLALQLELLRRRIEKRPEAAAEVMARMNEAIRSGVETVERLRAFSRQSREQEAESVSLDEVLATAVALCSPRLENARIQLKSEPGGAPSVLARKSEMVNAVVNLIFNAIDAIVDDGTITVTTGNDAAGSWIEGRDDGPGMPPSVAKHVFEPFFTTKEQGTGLGLATVYAFVQRHGGNVTLDTDVGQGTRFRLWFPWAPGASAMDVAPREG